MAVNWDKVPNLPPNLRAFGNGFNRRFPKRDGASDGAWGDDDHKLSPSGHNPDDTAGSRSESEDADRKPELRAADVDADLREPGVSMDDVADALIADPDVQRRMLYIIWNGRIAGQATGWKWRPYNGDNRHDKHLHGSGDPDHDENGAPFSVLENFGKGDDDMSERASNLIEWAGTKSGKGGQKVLPEPGSPLRDLEQVRDINGKLDRVLGELTALKSARVAGAPARSESAEALQAGVVTPLSIEKNLTAASTKQLEAELSKRADRSAS